MASLIQTQLTANALLREHGLMADGWRFAWDNAKKRGGSCNWTQKKITMSKYLVPMWTDEQVRMTLLHEVAHALAGFEAHHGCEWQRIAISLGHHGRRYHTNPTQEGKWLRMCPIHGKRRAVHRRQANLQCGLCGKAGKSTPVYYIPNPDVDNRVGVR